MLYGSKIEDNFGVLEYAGQSLFKATSLQRIESVERCNLFGHFPFFNALPDITLTLNLPHEEYHFY